MILKRDNLVLGSISQRGFSSGPIENYLTLCMHALRLSSWKKVPSSCVLVCLYYVLSGGWQTWRILSRKLVVATSLVTRYNAGRIQPDFRFVRQTLPLSSARRVWDAGKYQPTAEHWHILADRGTIFVDAASCAMDSTTSLRCRLAYLATNIDIFANTILYWHRQRILRTTTVDIVWWIGYRRLPQM